MTPSLRTPFLIAAALIVMAAQPAAGQRRAQTATDPGKGRYGTLAIVSAGSEQALHYGNDTLPRPFGARLVDRIDVVSHHRAGPRDLFLVRGAAGSSCPASYVVVSGAAKTPPTISEPFGTCRDGARAQLAGNTLSILVPGEGSGPWSTFVYADGVVRPAAGAPAMAAAAAPQAPNQCRIYDRAAAAADTTEGPSADTLLADFEVQYPAELRTRRKAEKAELAPARLQELVVGLACLATWPGADPLVPDTATPLFASKRHGAAAFAQLEAVARARGASANLKAAARAFAAQMRYYASDI